MLNRTIICTACVVSSPKLCCFITNTLGDRNVQNGGPPGTLAAKMKNFAGHHHVEMMNLLWLHPKISCFAAYALTYGRGASSQMEFSASINSLSTSDLCAHPG